MNEHLKYVRALDAEYNTETYSRLSSTPRQKTTAFSVSYVTRTIYQRSYNSTFHFWAMSQISRSFTYNVTSRPIVSRSREEELRE